MHYANIHLLDFPAELFWSDAGKPIRHKSSVYRKRVPRVSEEPPAVHAHARIFAVSRSLCASRI